MHQVFVKGSLNKPGFKQARFIAFFKLLTGKAPVVVSKRVTGQLKDSSLSPIRRRGKREGGVDGKEGS